MENPKIIEFVGYSGVGREYVAASISKQLLEDHPEIKDQFKIECSGTHIFSLNANEDQMINYMRKILHRAKKLGIFDNDQEKNLEFALGINNFSVISEAYKEILPQLKEQEKEYLSEAMKSLGVEKLDDYQQRQTSNLINARHIFCMEKDNLNVVNKIYLNNLMSPKIELLEHFGDKIEGSFGKTSGHYKIMTRQIRDSVYDRLPDVIQRLSN